jgi:hypothetical protein
MASNSAASGMVRWEGEAPAEPCIPCACYSCSCGSAGASPSRIRLVTRKFVCSQVAASRLSVRISTANAVAACSRGRKPMERNRHKTGSRECGESTNDVSRQQNWWASSCSGSRASSWYSTISYTSSVLKPYDFLNATFALVFIPSTLPLES